MKPLVPYFLLSTLMPKYTGVLTLSKPKILTTWNTLSAGIWSMTVPFSMADTVSSFFFSMVQII